MESSAVCRPGRLPPFATFASFLGTTDFCRTTGTTSLNVTPDLVDTEGRIITFAAPGGASFATPKAGAGRFYGVTVMRCKLPIEP